MIQPITLAAPQVRELVALCAKFRTLYDEFYPHRRVYTDLSFIPYRDYLEAGSAPESYQRRLEREDAVEFLSADLWVQKQLQHSVEILKRIQRFAEWRRIETVPLLTVAPLGEYERRTRKLTRAVSSFNETHVLVQLYVNSFILEHQEHLPGRSTDISSPVLEALERFDKRFAKPLLNARDRFFARASPTNLERFVATAERLNRMNHPLTGLATSEAMLTSSPFRTEQAANALEQLTMKSLMAPLLAD